MVYGKSSQEHKQSGRGGRCVHKEATSLRPPLFQQLERSLRGRHRNLNQKSLDGQVVEMRVFSSGLALAPTLVRPSRAVRAFVRASAIESREETRRPADAPAGCTGWPELQSEVIFEPFRIKMVEPIRLSSRAERAAAHAGRGCQTTAPPEQLRIHRA